MTDQKAKISSTTPAKQCKAISGLTLVEVSRKIGKPPQTLQNWFKYNKPLFDAVCRGVINE